MMQTRRPVVVRRLWPRLLDQARYARWVEASHALDTIFPTLVGVIQGIGRIDAELCAEDSDYFTRRAAAKATKVGLLRFDNADLMALTDRFHLSAFWLFGAYEAARTLDAALENNPKGLAPKLVTRAKVVKQKFARPRMLLAKQEAANRHTATDLAAALPRSRRGNLGWKVAPGCVVIRRVLADSMIDLLERIAKDAKRRKRRGATP